MNDKIKLNSLEKVMKARMKNEPRVFMYEMVRLESEVH